MLPARAPALLLAAALSACADSSGVTLFGRVGGFAQDVSNGVAVAGAIVTVGDRTVVSGQNGTFSIDRLVPGEYTLTATYADFEPFFQAITVRARQTTAVSVLLTPGGFSIGRPDAIAAQPGHNRGGITIEWTPLSAAVNYALYWSTDPGVPPTAANRIGGVTSPFVHTQRQAGTTYYYAVAGLGIVGEGQPSDIVSAVPYDHIGIQIHAPALDADAAGAIALSVRVDSDDDLVGVTAELGGVSVPLAFNPDFFRWEGVLNAPAAAPAGPAVLTVTATDVLDRTAHAMRMLRYPN